MLGKVMITVWAELGLKIEKTNESIENPEVYISVPEHSCNKNSRNEEMSGTLLARRFKTAMQEMGAKNITVKSRIRKGEFWTKEMGEQAGLDMKRLLYKIQF